MSWVRCNKFSSVNLLATLLFLSRPTKALLPRNRLDKLLDCFRTDFRDRDGRRCLDFQHDIDAEPFVAVRVRPFFERLPIIGRHCALFIVMAGDIYIYMIYYDIIYFITYT